MRRREPVHSFSLQSLMLTMTWLSAVTGLANQYVGALVLVIAMPAVALVVGHVVLELDRLRGHR